MEKNLPVLYKSQWDDDAGKSYNDCGPASVAMVLNYLGTNVTTDEIHTVTGAGGGIVSLKQIQSAISHFGFKATVLQNGNIDVLKSHIDRGIPVICIVHYGSLESTQDKAFKNGHYLVVVGYRPDDSLYVNDPNFRGKYRQDGDHHVYRKDEFMRSWGDAKLDGNKPFQMIVIEKPVEKEKLNVYPFVKTVVTTAGKLRVRITPTINDKNIVANKSLTKGKKFDVDGFTVGDEVNGNAIWYKLKGEDLFTWTGGTNLVPVLPHLTVETTPEAEPKVENYEALYRQTLREKDGAISILRDVHKQVTDYLETIQPEAKFELQKNDPEYTNDSKGALNWLMTNLGLKK